MHSAPHHSPSDADDEPSLCLQIQVDLSAMIDGELDAAGVRRVTAHVDACAACRAFHDGILRQAGLHRRLAASRRSSGPVSAAERASFSLGGRQAEFSPGLVQRGLGAVPRVFTRGSRVEPFRRRFLGPERS